MVRGSLIHGFHGRGGQGEIQGPDRSDQNLQIGDTEPGDSIPVPPLQYSPGQEALGGWGLGARKLKLKKDQSPLFACQGH